MINVAVLEHLVYLVLGAFFFIFILRKWFYALAFTRVNFDRKAGFFSIPWQQGLPILNRLWMPCGLITSLGWLLIGILVFFADGWKSDNNDALFITTAESFLYYSVYSLMSSSLIAAALCYGYANVAFQFKFFQKGPVPSWFSYLNLFGVVVLALMWFIISGCSLISEHVYYFIYNSFLYFVILLFSGLSSSIALFITWGPITEAIEQLEISSVVVETLPSENSIELPNEKKSVELPNSKSSSALNAKIMRNRRLELLIFSLLATFISIALAFVLLFDAVSRMNSNNFYNDPLVPQPVVHLFVRPTFWGSFVAMLMGNFILLWYPLDRTTS